MPSSINYCLFEGRYYFVTDIVQQSNHKYEISATIDVLATYKDAIRGYNTFVERSASDYDLFVHDNYVFNSTANQEEYSYQFQYPSTDNFYYYGCYVVRVVSGDGIIGYAMDIDGLKELVDFLFSDTPYDAGELADDVVKTFFNPFQYIVDVMWFPVLKTKLSNPIHYVDEVQFGWWKWNPDSAVVEVTTDVTTLGSSLNGISHHYGDFRDYEPQWTQYKLSLPGVGVVELEPNIMALPSLNLICRIDVLSGGVIWNLVSRDGSAQQPYAVERVVAQFNGQIGVSVQIGQLTADLNGIVSSVSSTVHNFVGAASMGKYNPIGSSVNIITDAIVGAIDITESACQPQSSINGSRGNMAQIRENLPPKLSVTVYKSTGLVTANSGRPLYQYRTLGNLSGYVKCGAASLEISGFKGERERVNALLNSGFYME